MITGSIAVILTYNTYIHTVHIKVFYVQKLVVFVSALHVRMLCVDVAIQNYCNKIFTFVSLAP